MILGPNHYATDTMNPFNIGCPVIRIQDGLGNIQTNCTFFYPLAQKQLNTASQLNSPNQSMRIKLARTAKPLRGWHSASAALNWLRSRGRLWKQPIDREDLSNSGGKRLDWAGFREDGSELEDVATVAEWYRYRIEACLVTSSSPVPQKTRRVGQRCTLNLSKAETSSRWEPWDLGVPNPDNRQVPTFCKIQLGRSKPDFAGGDPNVLRYAADHTPPTDIFAQNMTLVRL
ncbi:hypothetical protein TNCV_1374501 [Trichonephila clavipes]|nr:hypothetical protein TNCV_1374501 [Trichonephila clavipes]